MVNPVIQEFIAELNQTWQDGRYDSLPAFFDADVVMLVPGRDAPIVGVDGIVEAYRQFGEAGTVHGFEVDRLETYPFGDLVMCHMAFTIDYELDTGRYTEHGVEAYAIRLSQTDPPCIVWRTQIIDY